MPGDSKEVGNPQRAGVRGCLRDNTEINPTLKLVFDCVELEVVGIISP